MRQMHGLLADEDLVFLDVPHRKGQLVLLEDVLWTKPRIIFEDVDDDDG